MARPGLDIRLANWLRGKDLDEPGWRRILRFVVAAIVAATVLGVVSKIAGPQWHPKPLVSDLTVETEATGIVSGLSTVPVGTYDITETIIDVQLTDNVSVQARILAPVDAPPGQPAMLFVHGAGTGKYVDAFVDQAQDLASAGIVTMVPNKRLDTYTTSERNYPEMAVDYMKSFDILANWPGVDPAQVGVYCESEGCWIAPIMAAGNDRVAYVALISAPVVQPRMQAAFAVDNYLHATNVPGELFRAIPRLVGLEIPALGFGYLDFDVRPFQQLMSQPVFMAYGTGDMSMPLIQGAEWVMADVAEAGSPGVTLRYYEGADHGIRVDKQVVGAFISDLARWVQVIPTEPWPTPHIAGAMPEQKIEADPVESPRWYMNGWLVLGWAALGVLLLAFPIVFGLVRWITRRPRRPLPPALRLPLFLFGLLSAAATVALVTYFQTVAKLALNYQQDDLYVTGGWLVVRIVAVLAVLAGLSVFERRNRPASIDGWSLPAWITYGSTAAGGTILVLLLGYWGVFPFSW